MFIAFELILLLLALQAFIFYVILLGKQKIFHLVYTFFMLYISYRLYSVYAYVNEPATGSGYSRAIIYIISGSTTSSTTSTDPKNDLSNNIIGALVFNILFTLVHMWQFFAPSRIALNANSLPSYGGFRMH
jgi:hypothetical protein